MELTDLRRYAVSRSLFAPTTLQGALDRLGFVQADPIRAPARAQDLTLRHRVDEYRSGDLDRSYPALEVEEDVFLNYGFVSRSLQTLIHPRAGGALAPAASNKRARALLDFVRSRGAVHPREVDAHFAYGVVTNYWGGSSRATTHLLELMHYKGLLRVARRERGIRIYAVADHGAAPIDRAERDARIDAVVDAAVRTYAPLPAASLSYVVSRLRYAVPQWRRELRRALLCAKQRLARARVGSVDWYWPASDHVPQQPPAAVVRLLAPFDPIVWDRRRFELLWGWSYRFEAYTPVGRRKIGYYALPLLWRDVVVGWGNVSMRDGTVHAEFGYAAGRPPRDRAFRRELDAEVERMRRFLA